MDGNKGKPERGAERKRGGRTNIRCSIAAHFSGRYNQFILFISLKPFAIKQIMKFSMCIISSSIGIGDCVLLFANQFNVNLCKSLARFAMTIFQGVKAFQGGKLYDC